MSKTNKRYSLVRNTRGKFRVLKHSNSYRDVKKVYKRIRRNAKCVWGEVGDDMRVEDRKYRDIQYYIHDNSQNEDWNVER
jgi:hypothetical protein